MDSKMYYGALILLILLGWIASPAYNGWREKLKGQGGLNCATMVGVLTVFMAVLFLVSPASFSVLAIPSAVLALAGVVYSCSRRNLKLKQKKQK